MCVYFENQVYMRNLKILAACTLLNITSVCWLPHINFKAPVPLKLIIDTHAATKTKNSIFSCF